MTQPAVNETPLLTNLKQVPIKVLVKDMNYLFHYDRVKKPDDNMSTYFNLHYKEAQQENWLTCKNLLSDKFTAVRTDLVIEEIQRSLGGHVASQFHYRSGTAVKCMFTLSGYQIDIDEEPEMDRLLFKIITNIDAGNDVLSSANLTFNLINGFSGNHALQLNYGLLKTLRRSGQVDGGIIPFNNVFILDKYSKRLIHDNNISISIEDVTNVQTALRQQVELFKRFNFGSLLTEELTKKLPKKFGIRFNALYESIPENLRNFYYCSFILSSLIDSEKKIDLEVKLRAWFAQTLNQLIKTVDSVRVQRAA